MKRQELKKDQEKKNGWATNSVRESPKFRDRKKKKVIIATG